MIFTGACEPLHLTKPFRQQRTQRQIQLAFAPHSLNSSTERNSIMTRIQRSKFGFVLAAGASFLFSVYLWFTGSKEQGMFVGLWVPSILSFATLTLGGKSNE